MQSNGGLGSARTIAHRAVQTVLSGPAAGVVGGARRRDRQPEADLHDDRHGRDELRHRLLGRGGGEHLAGVDDLRPPDRRRGARHPHPRRRRGLDRLGRLGRRAPDRPAERRVAAGPGVLRPRWRACDRDRRERRARAAWRRAARWADRASTPTRRIVRSSDRSRDRSASTSSRRRAEWSRSSTQPWRRGCISCRWDEAATHASLGIVGFGGAGPLHACELAAAIGMRRGHRPGAAREHLGDRPPARGSPPRAERSRPRAAGRARRGRRGVDPRPAHARGRRRPGRRRGGKRDGHDSGGRAALVRGTALPARHPVPGRRVGWRTRAGGLVDGARRAVSRTSPLAVRLSPR